MTSGGVTGAETNMAMPDPTQKAASANDQLFNNNLLDSAIRTFRGR